MNTKLKTEIRNDLRQLYEQFDILNSREVIKRLIIIAKKINVILAYKEALEHLLTQRHI